jgi:flagellar biosynthesis protein FliP
MKRITSLLPLLVLLLVLMAPSFAFAATLQPAAANASAAASNSGLSIDVTGSGLFTDRMVQIVAVLTHYKPRERIACRVWRGSCRASRA